jgi:hypothetical protein
MMEVRLLFGEADVSDFEILCGLLVNAAMAFIRANGPNASGVHRPSLRKAVHADQPSVLFPA